MDAAIRPARPDEIEIVRALEQASAQRFVGLMDDLAHGEPSPGETLAARIAADGLLVIQVEHALVAFVMFRPVEDGLYVEQIDVLPSFERRGLGAALLDAVADRARDRGLARLTLSTFRNVPWNAPYYRRLGFTDIADDSLSPAQARIRREHYARGLDETARVFMERQV